ncbi:MAG: phosphoribosylformylglycinamidine cyclo-ligase [Candidatus Aenigmarchaeota archaeon]|nr:phosphoribosylformylglycinamidine cyclo-ligase [Candidatus Aenigmarchaeota archaeon]
MPTYKDAGVDREARAAAKKLLAFDGTHSYSKYGPLVSTPFNTLYPTATAYQVKTADTVGTKAMLAQLAGKHDTIGIDAVAMVVNDCIRSGAEPIALTNTLSVRKSDAGLIGKLQKGLADGAAAARCPMVGGEIADVPELLAAAYDIGCDCVGEVQKESIIYGTALQQGDAVIGLRSSGLHANGMSLARKVLFREWGGAYEAHSTVDGMDRELVFEALEPTAIYVQDFMKLMKEVTVLAAVNITGDAYLKFGKLMQAPGKGFAFSNFHPQSIFHVIQEAGNITAKEMFSTFNMGWGFAVIVRQEDSDTALGLLKHAEIIGSVTGKQHIIISHEKKDMVLV